MVKNIGLLGCGQLGAFIGEELERSTDFKIKLVVGQKIDTPAVCLDRCWNYSNKPDLLLFEDLDFVIEAASPKAVSDNAEKILRKGCNFVTLSSSALLDKKFLMNLIKIAEMYGSSLMVPSGSIGGLDLIRAIPQEKIKKAVLNISRHSLGWQRVGLSVNYKKDKTIIKQGFPEDLCSFLPRMNVAATLQLILNRPLLVKLVIDNFIPRKDTEFFLEIKGIFGYMNLKLLVSRLKGTTTAILPALSVISLLKNSIKKPFYIGS